MFNSIFSSIRILPHSCHGSTWLGSRLAIPLCVATLSCSDQPRHWQDDELHSVSPVEEAASARFNKSRHEPKKFPTLQLLSTHRTDAFDEGAAEIVDFDPASQRVFIVNSNAQRVTVLPVAHQGFTFDAELELDPTQDLKRFESGGINSLATSNGVLAIALEAKDPAARGRVAFYDTSTLQYLAAVPVGVMPDMLTFTPDGSRVLVANEGESIRNGDDLIESDPAGSVSIIDLRSGLAHPTVVEADFSSFDGRAHGLRNRGVRSPTLNDSFFAGGAGSLLPSSDFEPEYIAVGGDGLTAYVALQENNALGVLDVASGSFTDVLALGVKDFSRGLPSLRQVQLSRRHLPVLGETDSGQTLRLGGFSGLWHESTESSPGKEVFYTVADRGPTAGKTNFPNDGRDFAVRPHLLPNYTASIQRMELNKGRLRITDLIPLTRGQDLTPISGRPNHPLLDPSELPTDARGNALNYDAFGADFEGLVIDPHDQSFWLVDEYRCAIYNFTATGKLLHRFVPEGTSAKAKESPEAFGSETLPPAYLRRRANRGFEAVALDPVEQRLYAFLQSPLSNPSSEAPSQTVRIVALDTDKTSSTFGQPVAEYIYLLEGSIHSESPVDKLGDAVFAGPGKILVIERDSAQSRTAKKYVFQIDLRGATNVLGTSLSSDLTLEQSTPDQLLGTQTLVAVHKRKLFNLPSLGYRAGAKLEGLALLPDGRLAVLNDNDFGISDSPAVGDGSAPLADKDTKTVLGLIEYSAANGLDASDRDSSVQIRKHPVFGAYMPDAIASFETKGQTFLITANEGDSRGYDEARVKSLSLDPESFPNAEELQRDENLGRLKVSLVDGDLDGDGDLDQLHAFGARSVSIWDAFGNLVFDTGSLLETEIARQFPENFNSTNDENNSFDDRSDDRGPEPEGIVVGKIGRRRYAFVGLERMGGVVILEVTHPQRTRFIDYVNHRDFSGTAETGTAGDLGPEGLKFIPAPHSPTHTPLLLVANEVSGTTSLYQVNLPER